MSLGGKYDFKGIKGKGAAGLRLALAAWPWTAWLVKGPLYFVGDFLLELIVNALANRGLLIFNIGADYALGEFDQSKFDKAMDAGLSEIEKIGRDKIDPKRGATLDERVRAAARKYLPFNR